MSQEPAISIIMAVKNGAATLNRALQSIVEQTYQNFEVIIINDGSTDATAQILADWQQKFGPSRYRTIHNPAPRGQTVALNQGIHIATGKYIARLDADDWWTADKLEQQVKWLEQHPDYGLLGSAWINHGTHGQQTQRSPSTDAAVRRRIYFRNPFGHSCVMIRRDILERVGGYDESITYGQDLDLWFRLLPVTKLANLSLVLCHRATKTNEKKQRQQMQQTITTLKKYISTYRPSWWARGGFIEPWLLINARWLFPSFMLLVFFILQLSTINYGTTINDLPFIKNAEITEDTLVLSQQQLQRQALVSPDITKPSTTSIDQGLLRFKLYSVEADEMINIMALARINPRQLAFDPHFYMYGGAYLYPLGAFYATLIQLQLLEFPTLDNLLTNPNLVDRIYITGRFFVLVSFILSGLFLYWTARLVMAILPATLTLLLYITVPMTITHSLIMKPHWYALLPATVALYCLTRFLVRRSWTWQTEVIIGLCLGAAVGAATTYAPFAIGVWLVLLYGYWRQHMPRRALITIPALALAVFILSNPFIVLNFSAWQKEAAELQGWYQPHLTPSSLFYFIRNSLIPGFGLGSLVALIFSVWDIFRSRHTGIRCSAASILLCVILAATMTASVSFWHTSSRFIPFFLPLMVLYLAQRLPSRWMMVIVIITALQAVPHVMALRDENSPTHSTRLQTAAWIEDNLPLQKSICARLVPYDTAPFDFTRYPIEHENCHYLVRVERERPVISPPHTALTARFEPRFNHALWPKVSDHINPQISIYENLAAH